MIKLPNREDKRECVVLADGTFPSSELALGLLSNAQRVICCDGAAERYSQLYGGPMAIVGDCDSISPATRERFADIMHPDADQSTNDLTKAVRFAVKMGFERVTILGATGEREDHTLGNISLLWDYMDIATVDMITDYGVFDPICGSALFESVKGQQVSIFACGNASEVLYEGLDYRLPGDRITSWWNGTLNEATGESFRVSADVKLLIFRVI